MKIKLYQIDAFTTEGVFSGNPAAVCPLDEWLDDAILQKIAMENNLSETAFYVKYNNEYHIRWFTPNQEVDLCGHATLAAAFVLFNHESYTDTIISFHSKSGTLKVSKQFDFLTLNFPTDTLKPIDLSEDLLQCFDCIPIKAFMGKTDILLIFESESQIQTINPNFQRISQFGARGVIVSSKGENVDFVSRFFAPKVGIDEDPVTGSAHTTLIPYWANELGKNELTALQLSERKGFLKCSYLGDRVEISGQAQTYLIGEVYF